MTIIKIWYIKVSALDNETAEKRKRNFKGDNAALHEIKLK